VRNLRLPRIVTVVVLLVTLCAPAACSPDPRSGDRVSGKIVAAQVKDADPKGPQLELPGELKGAAQVSGYEANGKVGTQMLFETISFGQFNLLGDVVSQSFDRSAASMKMRVQRNGSTVLLTGAADLSSLTKDSAMVIVSVQFPGPVTATNGQQDSDDVVTWTLNSGSASALTAEAAYDDPSISAFREWAWIVGLVSVLVVVLVGGLAYLRRDRTPLAGEDNVESLVELPQWLREKLRK
jgi:hypothetical protein